MKRKRYRNAGKQGNAYRTLALQINTSSTSIIMDIQTSTAYVKLNSDGTKEYITLGHISAIGEKDLAFPENAPDAQGGSIRMIQ